MNYVIAPSILSANFLALGEDIRTCQEAGADWIHVDVMDGHFVPNLTMGPPVVAALRQATDLPLDVHLMVNAPERLLEDFARAGADGLTVHVETCPHLHRTLQQIRALGCRAGVTLNPGTPVSAIAPVLHLADVVLVMSVNPGFSGQAFLPEVLPKIAEVRARLDDLRSEAWLEVDGGISAQTIASVRAAGATAFVAGSAIFGHPGGIRGGIRALRQKLG